MLTMVLCMVAFYLLPRLPYVAHLLQSAAYKPLADGVAPHTLPPVMAVADTTLDDDSRVRVDAADTQHTADAPPLASDTESAVEVPATAAAPSRSMLVVLRKVWPNGLQVFAVFAVTLCLFPGVVTEIRPQTTSMGDWFPISLIVRVLQPLRFLRSLNPLCRVCSSWWTLSASCCRASGWCFRRGSCGSRLCAAWRSSR
jgi:hypothetical protein